MVCGHIRTVHTNLPLLQFTSSGGLHGTASLNSCSAAGLQKAQLQRAVSGSRPLSALAHQETHQGILRSSFCREHEVRSAAASAGTSNSQRWTHSTTFIDEAKNPILLSGCWFGTSEAQHTGHGLQEQLEWWRHERRGELHQHHTVKTYIFSGFSLFYQTHLKVEAGSKEEQLRCKNQLQTLSNQLYICVMLQRLTISDASLDIMKPWTILYNSHLFHFFGLQLYIYILYRGEIITNWVLKVNIFPRLKQTSVIAVMPLTCSSES